MCVYNSIDDFMLFALRFSLTCYLLSFMIDVVHNQIVQFPCFLCFHFILVSWFCPPSALHRNTQSQISIPLTCNLAPEIQIFQKQCSDFHILILFIGQKLRKQQLIPYFFSTNHLLSAQQKHSKRCIFTRNSKNPRTLGLLKNPRSREKSLGLATMPPCWKIKVRFYPIIF